jgi:hypothetical protein
MIPKTTYGRNVRRIQLTGLQVQQVADPVHQHQHQRAERHLHSVRAADQQQQLVDQEGHDQDVEGVAPAELGGGEEGRDALRAPRSCGLADRVGHPHDVLHLGDVVHPHDGARP